MFRGIHELNLDAKNRLAFPTKYREAVHEVSDAKLIMTIDIEERCLLLYLLSDWEPIEKKLAALPSFNKAARRAQRLILGHATELELDANGRVTIPAPLRNYAQLDKKLVLVGQGNKFELWCESHWSESRELWLEGAASESEEALPDDLKMISL